MTTTNSSNGAAHVPNADDDQFRRFEDLVHNAWSSRQEFFNRYWDKRTDIDRECSYPGRLDATFYRELYDRTGIAQRVVELLPRESWQVTPLVYEDESSDTITPFEKAWDDLGASLQAGGESWFKDEEGSPIWSYLLRADILSGIGSYGVLLFGFDDGKNLDQPVDGVEDPVPPMPGLDGNVPVQPVSMEGTDAQYQPLATTAPSPPVSFPGGERRLLFLRCFDESLVQIPRYETNLYSPRFGQPVLYSLTLNDPAEQRGGIGLPLSTVNVHWTRVLHLADNLGSSEIFGTPRQRPVVNNLLDLRRLYGGSAQMYWQGAFPGLSIETHPSLGGDAIVDKAGLREMMLDYRNNLQRWIALMGMSAKSLAPQVVDPTPQINVQLEAICIQLGCPIRVFKGSERGELASSQDDSAWNDRLAHRQKTYLTPKIIVPFIDRLIRAGVLPKPKERGTATNIPDKGSGPNPPEGAVTLTNRQRYRTVTVFNADSGQMEERVLEDEAAAGSVITTRGGYRIEWPDLDSTTKKDRSTIALQATQALAAYIAGGVEAVVPPHDFLTRVMGWNEAEAEATLADAQAAQEEVWAEEEELAAEQGYQPAPPEGFQVPEPPPAPVKVKPGEKLVRP